MTGIFPGFNFGDNMPSMPRPKGKPTDIAYAILGNPLKEEKKRKKDIKLEQADYNDQDKGRYNAKN